jgi:Protein of unknown function (DUF2934)
MSTYAIAKPGSVQRDLDKAAGKSRRPSAASSTVKHENIAQLAYFLWQRRGCPEGSPERIGLKLNGNYEIDNQKQLAKFLSGRCMNRD